MPDLFENSNTVTVKTSSESIASDYFSGSESVKSVYSNHSNVMQQCESPLPYAQRGAYAGRPALKCFACKKWGHVARYCLVSNNNMQRNLSTLKLQQGIYEVYSARWSSNLRHRGHSSQTQVPFKTQMLRLQTENSQLRQERHQSVEQPNKCKMEVASFSRRYSTVGNKSFVNSP